MVRTPIKRIVDSVAEGQKYHLKIVFSDNSTYHSTRASAEGAEKAEGLCLFSIRDFHRSWLPPHCPFLKQAMGEYSCGFILSSIWQFLVCSKDNECRPL